MQLTYPGWKVINRAVPALSRARSHSVTHSLSLIARVRLTVPGWNVGNRAQLRADSSATILAQIGVDLQLINAALLSHGEDVEMEDEEADDLGLEGSMDLEGKTVAQLRQEQQDQKSQRYELRQALADEVRWLGDRGGKDRDRETERVLARSPNFLPVKLLRLLRLHEHDRTGILPERKSRALCQGERAPSTQLHTLHHAASAGAREA